MYVSFQSLDNESYMYSLSLTHSNVLATDENVGDAELISILLQPIFQLLEVVPVHVDILGLHTNAKVVEQVQDVATLFKRASNASKAGDVNHHFPSL